jgi:hypothetical protein
MHTEYTFLFIRFVQKPSFSDRHFHFFTALCRGACPGRASDHEPESLVSYSEGYMWKLKKFGVRPCIPAPEAGSVAA